MAQQTQRITTGRLCFTSLVIATVLMTSACGIPSRVHIPDSQTVNQGLNDITALDTPDYITQTRILPSDTLRIIRDYQSPAQQDEKTLFIVQPDGYIHYPFIGKLFVAYKTPEEVSDIITEKLDEMYVHPQVTTTIAEAPSNRVFVGGAVPNPGPYPLNAQATLAQALISAGGIFPTGDSSKVALVRVNNEGRHLVYFYDFSSLLQSGDRQQSAVLLQRGDIIFVPNSGIGNAVEAVDMYVRRMFPGNLAVGLGFNYDLKADRIKDSGNTNIGQQIINTGAGTSP